MSDLHDTIEKIIDENAYHMSAHHVAGMIVDALTPKTCTVAELVTAWRRESEKAMQSALDEYCPEEFGQALDMILSIEAGNAELVRAATELVALMANDRDRPEVSNAWNGLRLALLPHHETLDPDPLDVGIGGTQ